MNERLAILISGGGTTMQEIIKATQRGEVALDIACVIASSSSAGGIDKARRLGINNITVIDPTSFKVGSGKVDLDAFGLRLVQELQIHGASVVTQNGWLPFTPERVIEAYFDTIFNQHPGPVPEFGGKGMYGRRVHAARLEFIRRTNRDFWTEAIAQRVHPEYDQGAVVKAEQIIVLPEDSVGDLQQRVLPIEHRVQIDLLRDLIAGTIKESPTRRLVLDGEQDILIEVKKLAMQQYPNG
jgi:phosphoribosylglycinamide formyltransferase-1